MRRCRLFLFLAAFTSLAAATPCVAADPFAALPQVVSSVAERLTLMRDRLSLAADTSAGGDDTFSMTDSFSFSLERLSALAAILAGALDSHVGQVPGSVHAVRLCMTGHVEQGRAAALSSVPAPGRALLVSLCPALHDMARIRSAIASMSGLVMVREVDGVLQMMDSVYRPAR